MHPKSRCDVQSLGIICDRVALSHACHAKRWKTARSVHIIVMGTYRNTNHVSNLKKSVRLLINTRAIASRRQSHPCGTAPLSRTCQRLWCLQEKLPNREVGWAGTACSSIVLGWVGLAKRPPAPRRLLDDREEP